jgi:hypothetical protein
VAVEEETTMIIIIKIGLQEEITIEEMRIIAEIITKIIIEIEEVKIIITK